MWVARRVREHAGERVGYVQLSKMHRLSIPDSLPRRDARVESLCEQVEPETR